MTLVTNLFNSCLFFILLTSDHGSASWELNRSQLATVQPPQQHSSLYELSLGDILPVSFFEGDDKRSYNFMSAQFRLVGASTWPLSPELVQSLHKQAKHTSETTRFMCTFTIGFPPHYQGPCKQECNLTVFPDIGNGDACRTCGQQHAIWQNKAYAGLDINISSNYTRHSMLIGTTMTSFAREASNTLHADGLQAHCFALAYNPQPEAARIAPYKPLAPLALKADAWAITFTASGKSVLPFGIENENKVLSALNAIEQTSQYTSFWRFKSITEDARKGVLTLVVILIRQPDRHGPMNTQAAAGAVEHLEQKLVSDGTNWHLTFVAAKLAPEETIAGKFRTLAEYDLQQGITPFPECL